MARINSLTNYLTDVAAAIKTKKGDETPIAAEDFDIEIENLPGGSTINNQDKTITINGEYTADSGYTGLGTVTVNVPSSSNMWSDCGYSEIPKSVNDMHAITKQAYDGWNSSSTSFNNYFSTTYKNITVVPMIDTSNITSFSNAFTNCTKITDIPLLNSSKSEGFRYTFSGCTNLVYVPVLDTSKANSWNNCFSNCRNLNDEALNNILQMCINTPTTYTGTKTLYELGLRSGTYSVEKIQALPKYQNFINAGWSIGY